MSALVQTTAPAGEPITLADAKTWLRVDGTSDDVLITALIESARVYVETFTGRSLITQSWELALDVFPSDSRQIVLPRAPLSSVSSVTYYDEDGTLTTFSSASYFSDTRSQPGRIVLGEEYDWPEIQARPNAVVVAYVAGYGTPSQVPQPLRTAIRFLVSHWYENRVHVNIGNSVNQIPDTVEALLWQHRLPQIF